MTGSTERAALQRLRSEILRVFGEIPLVAETRAVRETELRNWLGIIAWGLEEHSSIIVAVAPSLWADLGGPELERLLARVLEAVHEFRQGKTLMADVAGEIGRLEQKVEDRAGRLALDGRAADARRLREEFEAFRADVRTLVREHTKGRRS